MSTAATLLAIAQTTDAWSAVPVLSAGALFSLCTAAVGYGVVKAKTDDSAKAIATLSEDVKRGFADIDRKLETMNGKIGDVRTDVGRMEGSMESDRKSRRGDE